MTPQEFIDSHQIFGKVITGSEREVNIFRYPLLLIQSVPCGTLHIKGGLEKDDCFITVMDGFLSEEMCLALIKSFEEQETKLLPVNDTFHPNGDGKWSPVASAKPLFAYRL